MTQYRWPGGGEMTAPWWEWFPRLTYRVKGTHYVKRPFSLTYRRAP